MLNKIKKLVKETFGYDYTHAEGNVMWFRNTQDKLWIDTETKLLKHFSSEWFTPITPIDFVVKLNDILKEENNGKIETPESIIKDNIIKLKRKIKKYNDKIKGYKQDEGQINAIGSKPFINRFYATWKYYVYKQDYLIRCLKYEKQILKLMEEGDK